MRTLRTITVAVLLGQAACVTSKTPSETGEAGQPLVYNLEWSSDRKAMPPSPLLQFKETSAATIPPDASSLTTSCIHGVTHISHNGGGRSLRIYGDCLALPTSPGCYWTGGAIADAATAVDAGIVDEYMTFPSPDYVGTTIDIGTSSCTTATKAPKYLRTGDDTVSIRVGGTSFLQVASYKRQKTVYPSCTPVFDRYVNVLRRSANCGNVWATVSVTAEGFTGANGATQQTNFDSPYLYKDPFSTSMYFAGLVSSNVNGGVTGTAVLRSIDQINWTPTNGGQTLRRNGADIILDKTSIITGSDGTLVVLGCSYTTSRGANVRDLLAFYSYDNGATFSLLDAAVGACGLEATGIQTAPPSPFAANNFMPANREEENIALASACRKEPGTTDYTYFRVAFPTLEPDSTGSSTSLRQYYRVWTLSLGRKGSAQQGFSSWALPRYDIRPTGADDSIYRGSFIVANQYGPLDAGVPPDTAIFYWQEGRKSDSKYRARYTTFSGGAMGTFSDLSLSGGGVVEWTPFVASCGADDGGIYDGVPYCVGGGYDYGTYYFDPITSKMKFLTPFVVSETDAGPNQFIHYNVVNVNYP
jgi:hypothetical protein